MICVSIFKADLRVTSKQKALEFYEGVKSTILIPYSAKGSTSHIRVEPGRLISFVDMQDIRRGTAPFIPATRDEDGTIAYKLRRYINAYLTGEG